MNLSIDWAGNHAAAVAAGKRGFHAAGEWLGERDRRVLVGSGVLLAILLGALALAIVADHSRVLDAWETKAVRDWALSTQAPGVAVTFNEAAGDGAITVNEVRWLMEVAKGADLPEGLYQPVQTSAAE